MTDTNSNAAVTYGSYLKVDELLALQLRALVQQLLEPELVDLVDDDEEEFVVLRPPRARLLQPEQLVDLQVARIGNGRVGHDLPCGDQ